MLYFFLQIISCFLYGILGGGNSNIFHFIPKLWGNDSQFDEHIFQGGWFNGQGVGCARTFWGRKYTRMVLGQGRKYTRMVLARVARVTASSVHAVRGLICTRPRASSVHAEWFCCMYTFVLTAVYFVCSMCAGCQVQVFSNLTAVYFVCSMCAGCQVHNNAFWTCVKYVPKQSIP